MINPNKQLLFCSFLTTKLLKYVQMHLIKCHQEMHWSLLLLTANRELLNIIKLKRNKKRREKLKRRKQWKYRKLTVSEIWKSQPLLKKREKNINMRLNKKKRKKLCYQITNKRIHKNNSSLFKFQNSSTSLACCAWFPCRSWWKRSAKLKESTQTCPEI